MTKLYVLVGDDDIPIVRLGNLENQIVASHDASVVFSVLTAFKQNADTKERKEIANQCKVAVGEFIIESIL